MSENMTAQELIDYFEDRLQKIDQTQWDISVGEEPVSPMLIVFLGETSAQGGVQIAEHLFQLWPQYKEEIPFLCMQGLDLNQTFQEPVFCNLFGDTGHLDKSEVQKIVSHMFSTQNNFKNKWAAKLYYILDTTAIRGIEEYSNWMDAITKSRDIFGLSSYEVSDMLLLLLDENIEKKETAGAVKNALAKCCDSGEKLPTESVFLLSNRHREDNALCDNWQEHYHMIASIIALSNNKNERVAATICSPTIKTISYAREEKPSDQIGQVVVNAVLDYLAQNGDIKKKSVDSAALLGRMGFTSEGTIKILDDYVKKAIKSMLPSPEQIELFPREDMGDSGRLADLSFYEFNEKTMNAWDCFLANKVVLLKEKLDNDRSSIEELLKNYEKETGKNFSAGELLYLTENTDMVSKVFEQKAESHLERKKVLEAAEDKLRFLITNEPDIRERFQETFLTQCQSAISFLNAWDSLLKTRREVFSSGDATLEAFYEKRLRGYFDKNKTKLIKEFNRLRSGKELFELLKDTIDDIIMSDDIYSSPFEKELAIRLNGDGQQEVANQYIRRKLTKEDIYTYLQTNFALPDSMLSVVMLKKGISLHGYLQSSLGPDTYYYDTGIGKAAEAVKIYEISQNNLIN